MIRKYFVPALMAAALLTGLPGSSGKIYPRAGGGDEILRLY